MQTPEPSGRATVAEIMRRHFVTAAPEDTLTGARQTMRLARLRHLVVTRGEGLVGLLTYRELIDALLDDAAGGIRKDPSIAGAMVADPAWVTPDTPLATAAERMCRYGLGCLPVVERAEQAGAEPALRVVGLVTETDLLRAAFPRARSTRPA